MSIDYAGLQATAQALITEAGRSVVFRQLEDTPADAAKPWRGAAAPRNPAAVETTQDAAFVPISSGNQLGLSVLSEEALKRSEQLLLAAHVSVDLTTADEVVDGSTVWKVEEVAALQPGSTRLCYFMALRR